MTMMSCSARYSCLGDGWSYPVPMEAGRSFSDRVFSLPFDEPVVPLAPQRPSAPANPAAGRACRWEGLPRGKGRTWRGFSGSETFRDRKSPETGSCAGTAGPTRAKRTARRGGSNARRRDPSRAALRCGTRCSRESCADTRELVCSGISDRSSGSGALLYWGERLDADGMRRRGEWDGDYPEAFGKDRVGRSEFCASLTVGSIRSSPVHWVLHYSKSSTSPK